MSDLIRECEIHGPTFADVREWEYHGEKVHLCASCAYDIGASKVYTEEERKQFAAMMQSYTPANVQQQARNAQMGFETFGGNYLGQLAQLLGQR